MSSCCVSGREHQSAPAGIASNFISRTLVVSSRVDEEDPLLVRPKPAAVPASSSSWLKYLWLLLAVVGVAVIATILALHYRDVRIEKEDELEEQASMEIVNIADVLSAEYAERRVPPLTHQTPYASKQCQTIWVAVTPDISVCQKPLSNGALGVAFYGVQRCADDRSTIAADEQSPECFQSINFHKIFPGAPRVPVREVVVKFNTEDAVNGQAKTENGNVFDPVHMEDEIANTKLLESSGLYAKHLGTVTEIPELLRTVTLKKNMQTVNLAPPGIVLEYLEGPTAFQSVDKETLSCHLVQFVLAHAQEIKRNTFNGDLHLSNAIALTPRHGKFLAAGTECPIVRFIDLGLLRGIKSATRLARKLLTVTFIDPTEFDKLKDVKYHEELVQLVARVLQPIGKPRVQKAVDEIFENSGKNADHLKVTDNAKDAILAVLALMNA